jgi:hypothetical protein
VLSWCPLAREGYQQAVNGMVFIYIYISKTISNEKKFENGMQYFFLGNNVPDRH